MQVSMVERMLPNSNRVGILTISAKNISEVLLTKAGCAIDTPIAGTPNNREFTTSILDNVIEMDVKKKLAAKMSMRQCNLPRLTRN